VSNFFAYFSGKKTHILVIAALVLNAFGYMSTPAGINLDAVDSNLIIQELLIAAVSTLRLAIAKVGK